MSYSEIKCIKELNSKEGSHKSHYKGLKFALSELGASGRL